MTANKDGCDRAEPTSPTDIDAERILRERLDSLQRGEAGVPAEQVLAEVRQRLGFPGTHAAVTR